MNKHAAVNKKQAAIIRQFLLGCEATGIIVPNKAALLVLLGYKEIAPGIRVSLGTEIKIPFGRRITDLYKDEYHDDWEAITKADIEANVSTSESPEGDEVGDVLREEV